MQIAVVILLACMVGTAHAVEEPAKPTSLPQGTFQVKVTKNLLTLRANEARLTNVFEEIGKQAKISINSNLGPEEKITIQLDDVTLDEAFHQLAKNVTIFYAQPPGEKNRHITRVIVLAEGIERKLPAKGIEAPDESAKAGQTAPRQPPPKAVEEPDELSKTSQPVPRQPSPKRVEAPSEFSKTAPARGSPPFKFEFDPAASKKR